VETHDDARVEAYDSTNVTVYPAAAVVDHGPSSSIRFDHAL